MNTRILFKAQRADGQGWVYGLPVIDAYGKMFIETLSGTHIYTNRINPETVCQFVTVIDEKSVFSNDTFKVWLEDSQEEEGGCWWNCYVGIHKGCWCLLQVDFDYSDLPLDEVELLFETDYKLIPTGNLHDKTE